jgi:hypothetical protein
MKLAPEGYQVMHGDVRRINLRQFRDWSLWFRVLADNSVVVACLSNRMNPQIVKERALGVLLFGANLKAMWADLPGQLPLDDPNTVAPCESHQTNLRRKAATVLLFLRF